MSNDGRYASPPCLLHEVDPSYSGLASQPDSSAWKDVARWRKAERDRLVAARQAMPPALHRACTAAIAERLDHLLGDVQGRTISVYWPMRAEPDLRPWMLSLHRRGAICGLPVVVGRDEPMTFRRWAPGMPLVAGIWKIPVPAADDRVIPDVVLAPVVGFDEGCFRLGYGGGYFDRTLAAIDTPLVAIGVAFEMMRLADVFAQPHDMPMQVIVTESRVRDCRNGQGHGEQCAGGPGRPDPTR